MNKAPPQQALQIKRRRSVMRYAVLAVVLLPVFLLVFYRLSFIHPVSTLMLRDSILMRNHDRQWVSLDDISPHLIRAVIVAEDGRFCAHSGVDWQALSSVIGKGALRGASTISMQTVKNLFLWNGRSYVRKTLEIPLALVANLLLSKRRQLEIYLNIVEWAPGIYGAEAAARHYFRRSAKALSPRQAAALAVTLPNPHIRNPLKPSRHVNQLIQVIERRAALSGAYVRCLN